MARYILLKVEDNAEAAALVKQLGKWEGVYIDRNPEEPMEGNEVLVKAFVRAVWNVYDACKCETKKAWSEGRTSGLWVCATCKKPSKANVRGDGWAAMHGRNLLPISEERPEWRGPSHKNHPGYDPNDDTYTGPMRMRARGELQ